MAIKQNNFWRKMQKKVLTLFLVLSLTFVGAVIPLKEAYATCTITEDCPGYYALCFCIDGENSLQRLLEALQVVSFLKRLMSGSGNIATAFLDQVNVWLAKMGEMTEAYSNAVAGLIDGYGLLSKSETESAQSLVDAKAKALIGETLSKDAMQDAGTSIPRLCNRIVANGIMPAMESFEDALTAKLMDSYNSIYREAGSDGAGPQSVGDYLLIRHGEYGPTGTGPRFGNPLDDPEFPANFPETVDAAYMASTLDLDNALAEPPLVTSGGREGYSPSGDVAQHKWMGGFLYCYNVLGNRPSKLRGDNLKTAEGKDMDKSYSDCAREQNGIAAACFRRLAMVTRPNAANPSSADFFERTRMACISAKAIGAELPSSYDCDSGLTSYQASKLPVYICRSKEGELLGSIRAGDTSTETSQAQQDCQAVEAAWSKREQELEKEFQQAIAGVPSMRRCWAKATGN